MWNKSGASERLQKIHFSNFFLLLFMFIFASLSTCSAVFSPVLDIIITLSIRPVGRNRLSSSDDCLLASGLHRSLHLIAIIWLQLAPIFAQSRVRCKYMISVLRRTGVRDSLPSILPIQFENFYRQPFRSNPFDSKPSS